MTRSLLLAVSTALLAAGAICIPQQGPGAASIPASGAMHNATGDLALRHFNTSGNGTRNININEGVCYIEVPTASIAKDPQNVPAGNGSTVALSRIRTCCTGYKRHAHNFRRCDPVCTKECVNAVCTGPDTCTCFADFTKNLAGFCVPTCPVSCQNGRCSGGECICDPGYTLEPDSRFCVPTCRDNCGGHGNCTAPNTCDCPREFPRGADGLCRASCPNCENGDCVGPNQCRCRKGYAKNEQGFCAPVCSKGCTNGICAAPEVCTCLYGFKYDEVLGLCQPKCTSPCFNSLCTGPDTCTCKPGYVKDKNSPLDNVCRPDCPGGCPNGVCSNPNFCICNAGFVKDRSVKGSQKCVKVPGRETRAIDQA